MRLANYHLIHKAGDACLRIHPCRKWPSTVPFEGCHAIAHESDAIIAMTRREVDTDRLDSTLPFFAGNANESHYRFWPIPPCHQSSRHVMHLPASRMSKRSQFLSRPLAFPNIECQSNRLELRPRHNEMPPHHFAHLLKHV